MGEWGEKWEWKISTGMRWKGKAKRLKGFVGWGLKWKPNSKGKKLTNRKRGGEWVRDKKEGNKGRRKREEERENGAE